MVGQARLRSYRDKALLDIGAWQGLTCPLLSFLRVRSTVLEAPVMTRTRVHCWLWVLLALLWLSACTTTQRNVAAATVGLATFAADIALSVHNHTWPPGGLLGLFVCDLTLAALSNGPSCGEGLPEPIAKEESSR